MPTKQTSSFAERTRGRDGHHFGRRCTSHGGRHGPSTCTCSSIQRRKLVAVARDRVPGHIERVVALVVAVRVRRAARHPARRRSRRPSTTAESRRSGRPAPRTESTTSSTVTSERVRREHGLLLHADDALEEHVALPGRPSARGRSPRRAECAGPTASDSPVNGHVDELDVRIDRGEIGAAVPLKNAHGMPAAPAA